MAPDDPDMTPEDPIPNEPDPVDSFKTAIFRRQTWTETQFVTNALRTETIGGAILLFAAVLALVFANTPLRDFYESLRDAEIGIEWGGLTLSVGHWASDGLLAIFFFVAGLELKREFIVGELKTVARAAVPVTAAFGGVLMPALVFLGVVTVLGADSDAYRGWAIPTATDIAFALAVLAVISTHLPSGLRSFLLTLAVVDDLIAITIIAIFYTSDLDATALLLALVPLALFAGLTQRRITHWWLLLPLAFATWTLVHASGVHATVAGVLLGLVVPVKPRKSVPGISTLSRQTDVAHRFEHRLRPISAGIAVPIFAFFSSGVAFLGGGFTAAIGDEVAVGVVLALILGKLVGVFGTTYLMARFTSAHLDENLAWRDVAGLALLTGVGFTVSLLVGELAFGAGSDRDEHIKIGILFGSITAALLASVVLGSRNRVYRQIAEQESVDENHDGVPDVFQPESKDA